MTFGHGGNIYAIARQINCRPSDITDMSSNINPLGPPPGLLGFLKENIGKITRLPEIDSRETIHNYADFLGIAPERLLVGNGTTQFIYSIPRALESRNSIVVGPTYSDYQDALNRSLCKSRVLLSDELEGFQPDTDRISSRLDQIDTVYICNPNNPTGTLIPGEKLNRLFRDHQDINFVIDESYLPFVLNAENESMMFAGLENVIVLLSISKIFGIPGLRIGFLIANPRVVEKMRQHQLPWNVNSMAQEAVRYLLENNDAIAAFLLKTRIYCERQRQQFHDILEVLPEMKPYPGKTPFILARLPNDLSADEVRNQLLKEMVLIRNCYNFQGLSDQFIRISLKTQETNRKVGAILKEMIRDLSLNPEEGRIAC